MTDGPGPGRGRFPSALLAALRDAGPQDAELRVGLWGGDTVAFRRLLKETDDGLVGEVEEDRPGRGTAVVAVPWHAISRIAVVAAAPKRGRPGFLPPSE